MNKLISQEIERIKLIISVLKMCLNFDDHDRKTCICRAEKNMKEVLNIYENLKEELE